MASHSSTRGRRAFSEFTFHVATRIGVDLTWGASSLPQVQAVVWSDYLCPWCYLGRDRTALLERLDVSVTHRPYDLHPELPAAGRRVSATGRLADVFAYVGSECAAVDMPFRAPEHIPNTRRALLAAEVVQARWPEKFAPLDDAFFAAVFVDGIDIGDHDTLTTVMNEAGVDGEAVRPRSIPAKGSTRSAPRWQPRTTSACPARRPGCSTTAC